MPAYRSSGGLDDPILTDGDAGFIGMNQRLQPNQLQAGEVVLSKNGRMDGYWQPRRGIALRSGALASSAFPLRLPFYLVDDGFSADILSATESGGVVTIQLDAAHGYPIGSFVNAVVSGITGFTGTDPNGTWTVEISAIDEVELTLAGVTGTLANGEIILEGFAGGINTISCSGSLTIDGTTSLVVPDIPETGTANGKPVYELSDRRQQPTLIKQYVVSWSGSAWTFVYSETGTGSPVVAIWTSSDNTATPDGATFTAVSPATGVPTFTDSTSTVSATRSNTTVTLFAPGHSLDDGTAQLEIYGFETTTSDPNGRYNVTVAGNAYITYEIPSGTGSETYSQSGSFVSTIDNTAVTTILGSCLFSDPSSNNNESIILATGLNAKKVDLGTYTVTNLPYPGDTVVSGEVNMIQAFDKVYLFRDGGNQTWEWIPQGRPIQSGTYTSSNGNVTLTLKAHGLTAGDQVNISGVGFSATPPVADPNGDHTITSVTADTFTYVIATGAGDETYTAGTGIMKADGFTKVLGGTYTQPQTFNIQAKDVDVVSGLVTATVTGNTTIQASDFITVYETATAELSSMEGRTYQVVSANSTTITWYAPIGDYNTSSSDAFEFGGRFSIGGGFTHMPAPPWGNYFQRRLWVPFWYSVGGTAASPTYTDRVEHDQILASDILDGDTYDQIFSQFRITAGIADFTVGFHSFYDDNLIVFNRNSIHRVRGTQGSLEDTVVTELTSEVGCLARKTIVGFANVIFFLSDNGVYAIEFLDEYNLRGQGEPLSKNIQPFIDRINKSLADKAVATFYDNRYYIAVPLDSQVGADDASGNNTVLIYNMLNKAWESVDTFANGQFNIIDIHYGKVGARNALFYVNDQGGIHEANASDTPVDSASLDPLGGAATYNVLYELQSRGYSFGTYDRKKFSVAQVQCQANDQNTDAVFQFSTEDPDADKYQIGQINTLIGVDLPPNETANLRMRIGNTRGFYGQLTILPNLSGSQGIGRPKINSISVDATVTNRQTISQF